jgi:serine/threonine protein kinase
MCTPIGALDLVVATDNYKTLLGRGATGEVYLGKLHDVPIAVKRLRAPEGASAVVLEALRRRFRAELATLTAFQHPRIVRLLHTCEATGEPEHPFVLVFELLEGGSLADRLRDKDGGAAKRGPALSALQRVDAALGIAHGLKYLHGLREAGEGGGGAPVVHRDVKSANVGFSLLSGGGAGGGGADGELYAKLIDCVSS